MEQVGVQRRVAVQVMLARAREARAERAPQACDPGVGEALLAELDERRDSIRRANALVL